MNRLLFPVAGLILAALFVLITGGAGFFESEPDLPDVVPDAAVYKAPVRWQPRLDLGVEDAALVLPDGALTLEATRGMGLLNRDVKWVEQLFIAPDWTPVPGQPMTFKNLTDTVLHVVVKDGVVVELRAEFASNALSATATGLSPWLVGNRSAIGIHLEAQEGASELLEGVYETEDGRTFYYRAKLKSVGDGLMGPARLDTRSTPFPLGNR